jgi:hypothetical protein
MTASVASMFHQAKLGTADSTPATEPFEYVSNTVGKRGEIVRRTGTRGTRSRNAADAAAGTYVVSGTLTIEPTPADLTIWLPRILGAAANGTTFALAETLPTFYMIEDKIADVHSWTGCKVNRATFTGQRGQPVRLALDIEGLTESLADSFPSLTLAYDAPYVLHDLVLTLAGSAREAESFELVIDNQLVVDRFMNEQTRVSLPEGDRVITLRTNHPYASDYTDLYDQAVAGSAGALVLAGVDSYTTFTFAKLQVPAECPPSQAGEIMLPLNMEALKSGSVNELVVTHDPVNPSSSGA